MRFDHGDELGDGRDVLQRVATDDGVGVEMGVTLAVEVGDPLNASGRGVVHAIGTEAGIDPDTRTGARLQHLDEELAFAAPDLEDRLALQVVPLDPLRRELLGEVAEALRKSLGLLVAGRVFRLPDVERGVEDESARTAERQDEVAAWERARVVGIVEQETTVDRDAELLVEDAQISARTCRALLQRRRHRHRVGPVRIAGSGTGTMNWPPRAMYSCCCAMISSLKFQASSST